MNRLCVGDLVRRNALRIPEAAALVEGPTSVSWRSLDRSTDNLAAAMLSRVVGKGARVATIVRSGIAAMETLLGFAKAGIVVVPINHGLTGAEIRVLLEDSQPEAVVLDEEFIDVVGREFLLARAKLIVRGSEPDAPGLAYPELLSFESAEYRFPQIDPDEIRTIRYTSGTTGVPKGCLGTHAQILASVGNFLSEMSVPVDGPFLQMMPLFSGAGIWLALAAAHHGVTNVLMPEFDASRALGLIEEHRVIHTCGVPTMLHRLVEEHARSPLDLSSLRLFGYTGAKMPPSVLRRALDRWHCDFYQGFGGGEMGGWVAYLTPEHHREALRAPASEHLLNSAGRPAAYVEIGICDLKTSEPLRREGDIGEIVVRSASNFCGYLNRAEETARTLRGDWVHTGDVGYLDAEGFLYAVDRAKDMIISGGMNVSPAEVEAVLMDHPAVKSAAVIGLPNEEWGEAVTAVVVCREGQAVDAKDLIAFVRNRSAGYKTPKAVHFVDSFPLNSAGKVLKRRLREQFSTAGSQG